MDDIFYFSDKKVNLKDIKCIAEKIGYGKLFLTTDETGLQIEVDEYEYWQFAIVDIDNDFNDPKEKSVLEKANTVSGFCISHHIQSLNNLIKLLQEIGRHFGGWIGSDEDGFEPRFICLELKNSQ